MATVASELKYNTEFVQEQSPDVWWYDGERIVFRSKSSSKLLNEMKMDENITIEGLSEAAGINTAAVKKQLRQMTKKGYIQRRENSGWHVIATASV